MEKYIDMVVRGITKKELKNVLEESGLSKMFLKNRFFDGKVNVDFEEGFPQGVGWKSYNLDISAENTKKAAEIYNLILEKSEGKEFNIESTLYSPLIEENEIYEKVDAVLKNKSLKEKLKSIEASRNSKSGTGIGMGVHP